MAVGEPVGGQQVLGHVGVEAGAEDPEVAFDRERQRGGEQRAPAPPASRRAAPLPRPPAAPTGRRPRRPSGPARRPPRPRRRPASAPSPSTPRRAAPARPRAKATTSCRAPQSRDRRLPDRQRGDADRHHRCIGPDHEAASLDDTTRLRPSFASNACSRRNFIRCIARVSRASIEGMSIEVLTVVLAVLADRDRVCTALQPAAARDYDCADFANQAEAQEYLLPGDPYRLDGDERRQSPARTYPALAAATRRRRGIHTEAGPPPPPSIPPEDAA